MTALRPLLWIGDRFYRGFVDFVARPASPRPLAALRIGLAAVLLAQAYALAGHLVELYGQHGLVQWCVDTVPNPAGTPRLAWAVEALAPLGLGDVAAIRLVFLAYVAALGCLLVGWRTRAAAVIAWLAHTALKTSGNASVYGVDEFAHIALFYCVWMPVAGAWSLDRAAGRVEGEPSPRARLTLRVLQLHLCIVYFTSGVEKAAGEQWWNGEAIWRAVMRPDFAQMDLSWLAAAPWVAVLACWGTLLLEVGYVVFVWPRRTRPLWVGATVALHLGIAAALGLVSFAAVMIVLNVAAWLVPADGSG